MKNIPFYHTFIGNVTVNHANIIESEVFVYNLGTMYYIDDILYPEVLDNILKKTDLPTPTSLPSTVATKYATNPNSDIEQIPSELVTEASEMEKGKDILLLNERDGPVDDNSDFDSDEDDGEIITPRALPIQQFMVEPPK